MAIVLGDILRTTVNHALADGSLFQNVYHHRRTGVGVFTDQQFVDNLELWVEAMYGEIVTVVDAAVTEQLCSVDKVDFVVDAWEVIEHIGTFVPTIAYSAAGEALPNQISAFISFQTPRPRTVGRKFLFPMTEAESDAGVITAGTVTKLVAFADDAVNDYTMSAGNYLVPIVVRTGVDEYQELMIAIVTNLLGTQRRRRPGTGA